MSRILFVSHDADLRAVVSRVLARAGWDVTAVPHAGHASLKCLEQPFDVLIVEDQMPETSAGAVIGRLQRYRPGLAVIRLCERDATAGEGLALVRPFTADDLVDALVALTIAGSALPAGSGR